MQNSSSNFGTFTNELGASGQFIGLARNGNLMVVSKGIQDRAEITKELADIEGKLRSCNDPARLAEFAIWCSTKKVDFSSKLRQLAAKLETQQSQLLVKLSEIDEQLDQEDLVQWEVDPRPSLCLVPQRLRSKKCDPSLIKRDAIIEANCSCSTEEICRTLDDSAVGGEITDWMPTSWYRDYEVQTFFQAYRHQRLRNRVHKWISVRRNSRNYR